MVRLEIWRSGEYGGPVHFDITPMSTLIQSGSTYSSPSTGQIDLFKNYSYSIGILGTTSCLIIDAIQYDNDFLLRQVQW